MRSSVARFSCGKRMRIVYARSSRTTGVGGGRTFQNRERVGADFVRRKTRARGHDGVDLIRHRRAADGVVHAVEDIHDAVDLTNGFSDARRGFIQEFSIFGESLMTTGSGWLVRSPIMSESN